MFPGENRHIKIDSRPSPLAAQRAVQHVGSGQAAWPAQPHAAWPTSPSKPYSQYDNPAACQPGAWEQHGVTLVSQPACLAQPVTPWQLCRVPRMPQHCGARRDTTLQPPGKWSSRKFQFLQYTANESKFSLCVSHPGQHDVTNKTFQFCHCCHK